jgi:predicted DCC family thiol-disulfide oxidoreductase YuxK
MQAPSSRHPAISAAGSPPVLPTPTDLPEADLVIYDGNCAFCRGQVARLARWDGRQRLVFVSLHDRWVAERFPDLSREQLLQQMYVVTRDGRRYAGAEALRYLTRRLPRLWPLAPLLHIPFSLAFWDWIYRRIARRRYQLNRLGRCDDACERRPDPPE